MFTVIRATKKFARRISKKYIPQRFNTWNTMETEAWMYKKIQEEYDRRGLEINTQR